MNIIVTGASRGIGKAIALKLGKPGNNILINCVNNVDKLITIKEQITENGGNCMTFCGDVGDFSTCETMIRTFTNIYGDVDVLINNAGISIISLLQDMSYEDFNHIMNVNVGSVFNCCKLCIPYMLHNNKGSIINISSVWGNVGASCEVAYSATKGAVNAFTKALAKELAPSHINVNAIACGAIDTDMNKHLSDEDYASLSEEIPAGRFGSPDEVAECVASLLEAPTYLTGQIITLDGGWT